MQTGHIYIITNPVNGKVYVGQSVNPRQRLRSHLSRARKGETGHLYEAMRLYGRESFWFDVVATAPAGEALDKLECFYIKLFDARNPDHGYNHLEGGGFVPSLTGDTNPMYGKTHSDKAKAKIGARARALWAERDPERNAAHITMLRQKTPKQPALGLVHTDATKERQRQAMVDWWSKLRADPVAHQEFIENRKRKGFGRTRAKNPTEISNAI